MTWNGVIDKNIEINKDKLLIIAGPCMLENYELGIKTATFLQEISLKYNVNYIFKSSFDKANRSSYNSERGLGIENGLKILAKIKSETNLNIITDVHEPEQCQMVAEVCDLLQIPAFLCRYKSLLLSAIKTNKIIHLKKGQNANAKEIMQITMDLQNLYNAKIIICERGTAFGYNDLVVDFRQLMFMLNQNFFVSLDATHSTQLPGANENSSSGLKHMALMLAKAAIINKVPILFLEVHENPSIAKSDKAVQLNFSETEQLIKECSNIYNYVRNYSN